MKLKVVKFGHTLKVSENCKEIPVNKYYQRRIEEILFQEGIEKIGKCAFGYTNIKNLELPNSLKELGFRAFESAKIENLKLGENLKVIQRGTFLCNKIKELDLKNVERIEEVAFKSNEIEKINFNDKLEVIGSAAFYENKIKELIIPENVKEIEMEAFAFNDISKLTLNNNLKEIKSGLFKSNLLTEVDLKNVERIENDAFFKNKIEKLEIPKNVKYIGASAFANNEIVELKLNEKMTNIQPYTFYENKINKLEIPENIRAIGKNAFLSNNISDLKLNEGLLKIEDRAFRSNKLESVNLPSTIKYIGAEAFDYIDVYFRGYKFDKNLLREFGTDYLVKMADCKDAYNGVNFDLFYPVELEVIPADSDSLKGFTNSNKKYRVFEEEMNKRLNNRLNKLDYYEDFFKLCYILGVFRQEANSKEAVIRLYECLDTAIIHTIVDNIKLTKYDKKLANVIINGVLDMKIDEVAFILPYFYNNIDMVKKGVLKIKENKIMSLNKLIKKEGKTELIDEYNKLKKEKNQISIEDAYDFVQNNIFEISEQNKELRQYTPILNGNIEAYQIKDIENILNKAKLQKESPYKMMTGVNKEYTYKWLDNKDPLNLVLGYLVNCCAKYKGAGEDIMIQSMTNPNLRNLVVFKDNEVIAKSTAFYNNNYILCNNIEVSSKYYNDKSMGYEDKKALFEAIRKGLIDQARQMEENGNKVDEIRIGMCRNDLGYIIEKERYQIIKNELLANYQFNHYQGDANNKAFGQAIIYKK